MQLIPSAVVERELKLRDKLNQWLSLATMNKLTIKSSDSTTESH